MKQDDTPVSVLAVYDCPRDFPHHLVVRCWTLTADGTLTPGQRIVTFDVQVLGQRGATSAARSYCKRLGLVFVPRSGGDDPVLVETWQGRLSPLQSAQLEGQRAARPALAR